MLTEVRQRRAVSPAIVGLLIVCLVLAGMLAFTPGDNLRTLRRLAGWTEAPGGTFAFMETEPGSGAPVGYSPCRSIDVLVNPDGAPDNYRELVDNAVEHINAATGLRFLHARNTSSRDFDRAEVDYHSRRTVLIGWASPEEVPDLEGDVLGIGGSVPVDVNGRTEYATGSIVLDREAFAGYDLSRDQRYAQAVVDHEFGHVVGLDHVHDPFELMNEENLGLTSFGRGDLAGLALLGRIHC